MLHKLDFSTARFHENQELKLRYILAESPCVRRPAPFLATLRKGIYVRSRLCVWSERSGIQKTKHGENEIKGMRKFITYET